MIFASRSWDHILDMQNISWCRIKAQTSLVLCAPELFFPIWPLTRLHDKLGTVDYSCPNEVITLRLIEIEGALHLLGLDLLSWQS